MASMKLSGNERQMPVIDGKSSIFSAGDDGLFAGEGLRTSVKYVFALVTQNRHFVPAYEIAQPRRALLAGEMSHRLS